MKEIDPKQTKRAEAFELWMKAPMPMVTLFKTVDVTRLVKISRKRGYKFNMLMCWCIGRAASRIEEFYTLPVGEKLMQYDRLAVNTIVARRDGGISTCDVPFSDDIRKFNVQYLYLTKYVRDTGEAFALGDKFMVIGTSSLARYEIDGAVNIYAGFFNNPFMVWGRYRKRFMRVTLGISFQFHHTQMDGLEAAWFLECLQTEINRLTGRQ